MPKIKRLTRRDEIRMYIAEYARNHHNAPSTLEIAAAFELSQPTVYHHMMKLMAEKKLERIDGKWRLPDAEYIPPGSIEL